MILRPNIAKIKYYYAIAKRLSQLLTYFLTLEILFMQTMHYRTNNAQLNRIVR